MSYMFLCVLHSIHFIPKTLSLSQLVIMSLVVIFCFDQVLLPLMMNLTKMTVLNVSTLIKSAYSNYVSRFLILPHVMALKVLNIRFVVVVICENLNFLWVYICSHVLGFSFVKVDFYVCTSLFSKNVMVQFSIGHENDKLFGHK